MHKGYKCLDITIGHVYISRDVFDESVFPFSKLHPNAGKCLRNEILFPSKLVNFDEGMISSGANPTNASSEPYSLSSSDTGSSQDVLLTPPMVVFPFLVQPPAPAFSSEFLPTAGTSSSGDSGTTSGADCVATPDPGVNLTPSAHAAPSVPASASSPMVSNLPTAGLGSSVDASASMSAAPTVSPGQRRYPPPPPGSPHSIHGPIT
jgi:hypothetical protein